MSAVRREMVNGIAILKIDRPEAYNALSRKIVDEIDSYVEDIAKDEKVKVLIMHSDKNFAAGADVKEMINCNAKEAMEFTFSPTFNKLERLNIPTIAAIEGYALGGGLELALSCDLRVASVGAKLGFPEITLGIMPGAGGTIRASRIIGPGKAKELIFLGETIGAVKAQEIGLINAVVDQAEVLTYAMKWAEKLSKLSSVALSAAKQSVTQGLAEPDIEKAIFTEAQIWAALFNTKDQKEGMKAFTEKRKPVFRGK